MQAKVANATKYFAWGKHFELCIYVPHIYCCRHDDLLGEINNILITSIYETNFSYVFAADLSTVLQLVFHVTVCTV